MRPALQREHDLEGQKRGSEARTENVNEASAAAGARFGKDRSAGTRPALQRQRYLEGPKTPVLQRERELEQLEARKWGQRCSGSDI